MTRRRVFVTAGIVWTVGSVWRGAAGVALGRHWPIVLIDLVGFALGGYMLCLLWDMLRRLDTSTHLGLNMGMTSDTITDLIDGYIEAGLLPTDDECDWIRRFEGFRHLSDGRLLLAKRVDDGDVALTVTTATGVVEASVTFPTTSPIGLAMFVGAAAAMV